MAHVKFLKQVKKAWQTYEIELINYGDKCQQVDGWDDLVKKVKKHINTLAAMKKYPDYKVF
jgi:hypothetical protein